MYKNWIFEQMFWDILFLGFYKKYLTLLIVFTKLGQQKKYVS